MSSNDSQDRGHGVAEFNGSDAYRAAMQRGDPDPMAAYDRFNEQALVAYRGRAIGDDEYSSNPAARSSHIAHDVARADSRERHQEFRRQHDADPEEQRADARIAASYAAEAARDRADKGTHQRWDGERYQQAPRSNGGRQR